MSRFSSVAKLALATSPFVLSASVAYAESKKPIGVYLWGDNSLGLISRDQEKAIREPTPVKFFEGKKIKDLALSPQVAVAVLANGQTVQWTEPEDQYRVLKGEKIQKVKVWDDLVVALSSSGSIYTWHATSSQQHVTKFKVPSLGWFEKIVDFEIGRDSVVALTSKGNALTGLTREISHHAGQLGVASLSSFDPAPPAFELHSVKLLKDMKIKQVASGAEHVLFLLQNGTVFGCGSNKFGQIAKFNYNQQATSVPTYVNVPNVEFIAAGAEVSFFRDAENTFVAGNGIEGLFGTGSFSHVQDSPIKVPRFSNMKEYNENKKIVEKVAPTEIHISSTHLFSKLSNEAGDWLLWGNGRFGQLGTGKVSRQVKPLFIRDTPLEELSANEFRVGAGISAAFTKA